MKRSFTLLEVLISFMLFSMSLILLLPPLSRAGKHIQEKEASLQLQSKADEIVNEFYADLFQLETIKEEQLKRLFSHKEDPNVTIEYRILDNDAKQSEATFAGLFIEIDVQHKTYETARAKRYCYICGKVNK